MTTRKQRHKAYLDQHVKDENGEYRYVGEWYRLQGGSPRLYPFLGLALLTGAAVIASGCITVAGLKNTWYVIIPYIIEVSLLFALAWQATRLAAGRGSLKAFVFEEVSPRVRPLCGGLILAQALSVLCSVLFLLRQGPDGTGAACIAWFLLKALAAAAAALARRLYGRLVWLKA